MPEHFPLDCSLKSLVVTENFRSDYLLQKVVVSAFFFAGLSVAELELPIEHVFLVLLFEDPGCE